MTIRWRYAGWGMALALGSPVGALALRWILAGLAWPPQNWATGELGAFGFFYLYQTVGTMIAFGAAGAAAGGRCDQLDALSRRLSHLSSHDALTGLYNRRALLDRLSEEFSRARRLDHPLCCLMIDLDYFKKLNDRYGHLIGDAVLIEVASRLKITVRLGDVIGRLGGEEFLAILPETHAAEAIQLAERVRASVADKPFVVGEQSIRLRISVGVTEMELDDDPRKMIARCDDALYMAKSAGRNQVRAVRERMHDSP